MNLVTSLIAILKPSDLNLIRRIYAVKEQEQERNMRLKLLDLLIERPNITEEKAAFELYNTLKPSKAFYQLKKRLRDDIGHFLIMQDKEKLYSSAIGRAKFDCRRKLMIGELFINRGAYTEAKKILSKALRIAQDYELFGELVMICDVLRTSIGPKEGLKAYEKYSQLISENLLHQEKSFKAKELYYKMTLPSQFKFNSNVDFVTYGANILAEFDLYENAGRYYQYLHYLTSIFYYFKIKNYKNCLAKLQKFEELIANHSMLHTTTNLAWCMNIYADVYLNLNNNEEAEIYAQQACQRIRKNLTNRIWALEKLFLASFRQQKYKEAVKVVEEAMDNQIMQDNKLIKARWDFYQAIMAFSQKKWGEARDKLNLTQKLAGSDSSGWQIGYKLLEIMLAIEEREYYMLAYLLDNLKLLLHRQKSTNVNVDRAKRILKILKTYQSQKFDYKKTLQKVKLDLNLLEKGEDTYYWNPLGYEIIRFDEWFLKV